MRASLISATFVVLLLATGAVSNQAYGQGTKLAVVDVGYIFDNFHRFKSQMEDIKNDIKQFESFVQTERKKMATSGEQLKELNPGSTEYKQIEEQLVQSETNLRLQVARQRKKFLEQEAKVYYDSYTEVVEHVKQIASQNGINLVLRFSNKAMEVDKRESVLQGVNKAVVFQDGRIDITRFVLDRLNRYTPPQPGKVSDQRTTNGPQIPPRKPF